MAIATVLVAMLLHRHMFNPTLGNSGDVYASLPLRSELARIPLSTLLPTSYLSVWLAAAQLLVVLGLGELILGRWVTVMTAIAGQFTSTLVARVLLEKVHANAIGLAPALMHVLDTGPFATTAAVGALLLVATRMNRSAALLSVVLLVAALIAPGVDGIEHLLALVCGLIAGVAYRLLTSRSGMTNSCYAQ
ncbi:MAG: hypothetical protein ACYCPT_07080 [Acidimicrobiales bacterium]